MLLLHVDALAPATADLPPCRNLRLRQPLVHSGRNGCQASHHETHRLLPRSLCFEVGDVGFQGLPPGAPPGHARCIGRLVAQTCGLTSAQPRSPSAPLVYLSFQARGRRRLLVGGQAWLGGLLQAVGRRQQPAALVPDRGVRLGQPGVAAYPRGSWAPRALGLGAPLPQPAGDADTPQASGRVPGRPPRPPVAPRGLRPGCWQSVPCRRLPAWAHTGTRRAHGTGRRRAPLARRAAGRVGSVRAMGPARMRPCRLALVTAPALPACVPKGACES